MTSDSLKVIQHDKAREAEALQRKSSSSSGESAGDWLLRVPFAGRGMTNLQLSLGEIFNFTMAVHALDPAPGDLVLELGAGSCWVSEWLNRLLVDTVSLDYAHDMLRIGRQRLGPEAKQAAGDFERLPFADRSVDSAVCLSALHHSEDIPKVLAEVHRVLKPDGRVVFTEPGAGHSKHPQSRAETAELGVMERDIVVDELLEACVQAGFPHVSVQPYLYPPPKYEIDAWRRYSPLDNPLQSVVGQTKVLAQQLASKVTRRIPMRGVAASLHRRLSTAAVPDNLSVPLQSWRLLRNSVLIHPLVLAEKEKRAPDSRRPGILSAAIRVQTPPVQLVSGQPFTILTEVTNLGDTLWLSQPHERGGFVALGAKLLGEDGLAVVYDYGRGYLAEPMRPGDKQAVSISLTAPQQPGIYQVKLDMVDEAVVWFEHRGSSTVTLQVHVIPQG
jgi:SAM-dependent methyltransferase